MIADDKQVEKINDLFDFYHKWPQCRQHAVSLKERADIGSKSRETLHWLIELADRIGKSDLDADKGSDLGQDLGQRDAS